MRALCCPTTVHWTRRDRPVLHLHLEQPLPPDLADIVVAALDGATNWKRVSVARYDYEVMAAISTLRGIMLDGRVAQLLALARDLAARELGITTETRARLCVHRYRTGMGASLHSDVGEPGVRLLVFVASSREGCVGGDLLFAHRTSRVVLPVPAAPNTGVLFATGPASLHAVTDMQAGERYTLVFHLPAAAPR